MQNYEKRINLAVSTLQVGVDELVKKFVEELYQVFDEVAYRSDNLTLEEREEGMKYQLWKILHGCLDLETTVKNHTDFSTGDVARILRRMETREEKRND